MNKKRIKNKIIRNVFVIFYILFASLICSLINISYILSLLLITIGIHIPIIVKKIKKDKQINTKKENSNKEEKIYSKVIIPTYTKTIAKEKVKTRVRKK